MWDLDSGRAEATLKGHTQCVTACAMMPDGRRVVSASYDRTLKVWDLDSGRAEATLKGHAQWVTACAVTPDGRRVVSASYDRTLKVWDLASAYAEATLEGPADGVSACAVTPDGRRVVSASWDKTLKVWDLQTGACLLTHRGNTSYVAIATTATAIVAGDAAGAVWFLDWPSPNAGDGPTRHVTRDELLTRLLQLLPPQLDEVVLRANIPPQYLPATTAPLATRAVEALRYIEQRNELDRLARIVRQVMMS